MKSEHNVVDAAYQRFLSELPTRKEKVEIELHPDDSKRARDAALKQGMDFSEFCSIAIHMAVRDGRKLR